LNEERGKEGKKTRRSTSSKGGRILLHLIEGAMTLRNTLNTNGLSKPWGGGGGEKGRGRHTRSGVHASNFIEGKSGAAGRALN